MLANPPFVAVPDDLADLPLHSAWALFAAGGPAGDEVLRRIVQGAGDHLQRTPARGWLAIVTEVPNVKQTRTWLAPLLGDSHADPAGGDNRWESMVVFETGDVVSATEYSTLRAAERGWRSGQMAKAWLRGMEANDVHDMCSALFYAALCPHNHDADDSSDASMLDDSRDNPHFSLKEYLGCDRDFTTSDGARFVAASLEQLVGRQAGASGTHGSV